jgi:cell division protein FtsB
MPEARRGALTTRMTLLVVVICVLILTLAYPLRLYLQQQSQLGELTAQNAEQRKRVAALKSAVAGYDDPEWTRDEARIRLHFTQPGEKVYLAPTPLLSSAPSADTTPPPTGTPGSFRSGPVGAGQPTAGTQADGGRTDAPHPSVAPTPSTPPRPIPAR